jgi:hypothetical protein
MIERIFVVYLRRSIVRLMIMHNTDCLQNKQILRSIVRPSELQAKLQIRSRDSDNCVLL